VLSPDEKSVAVLMGDADLDAWIIDLRTGSLTRASRNARATVFDQPVWSPDSQRLAIAQAHAGIVQITLASGQVLPLINQPARVWDWSPDGSSILCSVTNAAGRFGRLSLLAAPAGTKFQTILDTPDAQGAYRFSPDGHSVAYASGEFGSGEIYVASFPSFAFKHKVSTGVGSFPLWVKGGKEIVYRSSDRRIMTAEIHIGATVESGVPKPLFQFGGVGLAYTRFAVTADGTRFLIVEPVPGSDNEKPELSLVLNWAAEMKGN
jgi:Tol biopolymer transport system component